MKMKESNDWSELGKMHGQNYRNAKTDMLDGKSPVIIDNTNIKAREPKMYVEAALRMGYDDNNIKIVDVGTNGLTAEALAKRNTHGVPLEKIKSMIASHSGVGQLTIKKIMEAKDGNKPKKIATLKLDEKSRSKLLAAVGHLIPVGWDVAAHHMTINFGKGLPENLKGDEGKVKTVRGTELGRSDMAMAIRVEGYHSDNAIPHVTIAVNTKGGGKPFMSNQITTWKKLENYINLSGTITESGLFSTPMKKK